jgi:hypothetical protein
MSTKGSASTLAQSLKELSIEWQQTKAYWRDAKCQEFERKYINDLPTHVTRAIEAIGEIDVLLRKVRKDCE